MAQKESGQLDTAVATLDTALRELQDLGEKKLEGLKKLHLTYTRLQ
eukprot:COSAG05_NODE_584_length_8527_cov_46.366279_9_plen_46_part_00